MTNHETPATNLPQLHEASIAPPQAELRDLNPEGAATFLTMMQERFQGMDNILKASSAQSLDAMEGASLGIDMVTEALDVDPAAYDAISEYQGPISRMAYAANYTHLQQTGHSLPEARFLSGDYTDIDGAKTVLAAVKQKMHDQRWDGTHRSGASQAEPTAAHGRKTTAIEAVRALKQIADARGQVTISAETVAKMGDFMKKTPGR